MYKIQTYKMKREEVPECWLLTPQDIVSHAIDELMDEEMDEEEELAFLALIAPVMPHIYFC